MRHPCIYLQRSAKIARTSPLQGVVEASQRCHFLLGHISTKYRRTRRSNLCYAIGSFFESLLRLCGIFATSWLQKIHILRKNAQVWMSKLEVFCFGFESLDGFFNRYHAFVPEMQRFEFGNASFRWRKTHTVSEHSTLHRVIYDTC